MLEEDGENDTRVSLKDRIHNADIKRTTGMKYVIDLAEGLKEQWGVQVVRLN